MPAFEDELLALLPRLRRFALALSRDTNEADDLCQASLKRALNARDRWQAGTRMDRWMYRIMRNLWIGEGRAKTRRGTMLAPARAGENVGDRGAAGIEAQVMLGDVGRAMARLPDEQREAVAIVLIEGLVYKDAAAVLEVPMGTLTSRLVRGRQALMRELEEAA